MKILMFFTLMNYVNIEAVEVPADWTCTQVSQKWHSPTSANMTSKRAVTFRDLSFERSEENKKQKRPLVSGLRDNFCAIPSLPEEIRSLVENRQTASNVLQSS